MTSAPPKPRPSRRPVYILGGAQTDFARNLSREGASIADLLREAVLGALDATRLDPADIEVAHIGNFIGELSPGQGHLGGLLVEAHPSLVGIPTMRHEAACASGSMAVLAAAADIEAERYDLACVAGLELMRGVSAPEMQAKLAAAAWVPRETEGITYFWPHLFSAIADEYDRRYGLDRRHLVALAKSAFDNARRNPNAQTRKWSFGDASFSEDDAKNPILDGRIRKHDCSQVTDGAAAVLLASEPFARAWAEKRGKKLSDLARIDGWGHRTARMALADKLADSAASPYVFPVARQTILDAFARAGLRDASDLDALEVHDCFTPTAYMAIDHFGLTPPGQSYRAIEDGSIFFGGKTPINPSGGLIGVGHPVGATGVRMLLDAHKQVTGAAGDYQVRGARRVATFNVGGSVTTAACFIVARAGE